MTKKFVIMTHGGGEILGKYVVEGTYKENWFHRSIR